MNNSDNHLGILTKEPKINGKQHELLDILEMCGKVHKPYDTIDFNEILVINEQFNTKLAIKYCYEGTEEEGKAEAEELVKHQIEINKRLRKIGLQAILVDIQAYEVIICHGFVVILCECMQIQQKSNNITCGLVIANCLELYIGLSFKGVRAGAVVHIPELNSDKILPFTNGNQLIEEPNNNIIIHCEKLVKFKQFSQLSDIQLLQYITLAYPIYYKNSLNNGDDISMKKQQIHQQNESILVTVRGKQYNVQCELQNEQLIISRIDGQNLQSMSEDIFETVDVQCLADNNVFSFELQNQLVILNVSQNQSDLKCKQIFINNIQKQHWYIALQTLLQIMNLNIQSVSYIDDKLYLRTLCKLKFGIPISNLEIQLDMKEQDFYMILDQCNHNPYIDELILNNSHLKDSLLQGLTSGALIKGIREISFRSCPFITDEGISLLNNFGVEKLDISYTNVQLVIPCNLKYLNIAYTKFEEDTLIELFRSKQLINLIDLDMSGIATDQVLTEIFSNHYKDLRNLIANNCKLSLSLFRQISESKHVKNLDSLRLQGSIVDVQESIFKKNSYQLLGSSYCMIINLDLSNCAINDKLVQYLVEGQRVLSNLKSLSLSGCKAVTDKSIQLLCEASSKYTARFKQLDISYLPQLTEYSLEFLTYRSLENLTDLNIANSNLLKSQDITKAIESGKFNQLKYLAISGISNWGGQAEAFKFGIPELCAYFIKSHLSELQILEIFINAKEFKYILNVLVNLIQCQILIKVTSNEEIKMDEDVLGMLQTNKGFDKLLINDKPIPQIEVKAQIHYEQPNQDFYEELQLKKQQQHCSIIISQQQVKNISLLKYFSNLAVINVNNTQITDDSIHILSQLSWIQQLFLKKCKILTYKSLDHLNKLSDSLISLDIRKTAFDGKYDTLKWLVNFQNLVHYNNGKILISIYTVNNNMNLNKELQHLPGFWLKLNIIRYFDLKIRARTVTTFKFLFNNISLLMNKNQDNLTKLVLLLDNFKQVSLKPMQLFNNSLIYQQNLITFKFGLQNISNIPFLIIRNLIISLQSMDNLRDFSLTLSNCHLVQVDSEIFNVQMTFEGMRNLKLESLTILANELSVDEPQILDTLFEQIGDIDTLKKLRLDFSRFTIDEDQFRILLDSLRSLDLHRINLCFDQCGNKPYGRDSWAVYLDGLRSNSQLDSMVCNFNHLFTLQDNDIDNFLEYLACLKLQECSIQLIGCLNNMKLHQSEYREQLKRFDVFI